MNSFNGIGRLTAEPELRQTTTGKYVCSFTLAVNRKMNKEQTDWLDCVVWGKTAEYLANYGTKGRLIAVEGEVQTRTYENKEGKKVKQTEILVGNITFLDKGEKKDEWSDVSKKKAPF